MPINVHNFVVADVAATAAPAAAVVVVDVSVSFMLDGTKTLDAVSVCQVTPGSPRRQC